MLVFVCHWLQHELELINYVVGRFFYVVTFVGLCTKVFSLFCLCHWMEEKERSIKRKVFFFFFFQDRLVVLIIK